MFSSCLFCDHCEDRGDVYSSGQSRSADMDTAFLDGWDREIDALNGPWPMQTRRPATVLELQEGGESRNQRDIDPCVSSQPDYRNGKIYLGLLRLSSPFQPRRPCRSRRLHSLPLITMLLRLLHYSPKLQHPLILYHHSPILHRLTCYPLTLPLLHSPVPRTHPNRHTLPSSHHSPRYSTSSMRSSRSLLG